EPRDLHGSPPLCEPAGDDRVTGPCARKVRGRAPRRQAPVAPLSGRPGSCVAVPAILSARVTDASVTDAHDTTASQLRWLAPAPGVLEALAVNAVPLWGLMHGAWSLGTILLFYWLANFLNTFFIGARILVHRAVTHKRGHWMVDTVRTVTVTRGVERTETRLRPTTFFANFVVTNLAFTLAHGVFVAAFVFGLLKVSPSWAQLPP